MLGLAATAAAQTATVSFASDHIVVSEADGKANIPIRISSQQIVQGTYQVEVVAAFDSAISLTTVELPVPLIAGKDTTVLLPVAFTTDNEAKNDRVFGIKMTAKKNTVLGEHDILLLYVLDDDIGSPTASKALELNLLSSYRVSEGGSAEIIAHHAGTQRLYVVNSVDNELVVLDFSNPAAIQPIDTIDMSTYGAGITSVAVFDSTVAVAVEGRNFSDGSVVFLDTDGQLLNNLQVGNQPDHVGITPDGNYLLTANEGMPSSDYLIDPEGSVSIIDLRPGVSQLTQANVRAVTFTEFNRKANALRLAGVRIYGPGASVSQDLEPEYIAFNDNSLTAYVTLQENNALAVVDIISARVTDIIPLGAKDLSIRENSFDGSDRTDTILFVNWPIKSLYQPDGIAYFEVNGIGYLATANEGDAREYSALDEEARLGDLQLDPQAFPAAAALQQDVAIGRLDVSSQSGDTDGDGDFDQVYAFGGRSFSIWDATTGTRVWDSGGDFERIVANDPTYRALFNASNNSNIAKSRSDNKGPEPEGILTATIDGRVYAFIGLERVGGVMIYDVTNPRAPQFVDWKNNRTTGPDAGGDLGPEGLLYLNRDASPIDTGLLVVANEVSATVSIYRIEGDITSGIFNPQPTRPKLRVFPNPVTDNIIFFDRPVSGWLFDGMGRRVLQVQDAAYAKLPYLASGFYHLLTTDGQTATIILP